MTNRRLGRHKSPIDKRTIHFTDVVSGELPAFPEQLAQDLCVPDTTSQYANDHVGDCTVASFAHLEEVWTGDGEFRRLLTTEEVVEFYSLVTGYKPDDPNTDNGANMIDVLRALRTVGIGEEKRRIEAYVKIDHRDTDHVKSAINLFGGVYVGIDLPTSAEAAVEAGRAWTSDGKIVTADDSPGSWGGHCVSASRYDRRGVTFRTWGKRQFADWTWWHTYVDECWAIVDVDWLQKDGTTPNGLDLGKLRTFLIALDTNVAGVAYAASQTTLKEGLSRMSDSRQNHSMVTAEAALKHPYSNPRPTVFKAHDPSKDPVVVEKPEDDFHEEDMAESHAHGDSGEEDMTDEGYVLTEEDHTRLKNHE